MEVLDSESKLVIMIFALLELGVATDLGVLQPLGESVDGVNRIPEARLPVLSTAIENGGERGDVKRIVVDGGIPHRLVLLHRRRRGSLGVPTQVGT